jgi:hypothetical protein
MCFVSKLRIFDAVCGKCYFKSGTGKPSFSGRAVYKNTAICVMEETIVSTVIQCKLAFKRAKKWYIAWIHSQKLTN